MQEQPLNSPKEQKVNINAAATYASRTRHLNDLLRQKGLGGKIHMTQAIHELCDDLRNELFTAIRTFDAFTADNDPYGEHDFAEIKFGNFFIMFKIDYYDKSERYHSPDKADPGVTSRVMTVMFSDEY